MGDLLIRNISDAMKSDIAARAERNGTSLSDEAKELLEQALISQIEAAGHPKLSAWAVLRPILQDTSNAFADFMEEVESERKKDFGRPFEDLP